MLLLLYELHSFLGLKACSHTDIADSQRRAGRNLRREPRRDGGRQGHRVFLTLRAPPRTLHGKGRSSSELIESLKLGNVWVFVQLNFGPRWPMNQLNKNPNIA